MQAGYSQRPLAAKLGIKSGMTIAFVQAPEGYLATLAPLPEALDWRAELTSASFDFIQYFTSERGPCKILDRERWSWRSLICVIPL